MVDKIDDSFLRRNVKGLMMDLVAQWNREMDHAQSSTEFSAIRPSDQRVFGHMRGRPTLLSDFHGALGISRQAAQQAVQRLIEHGVVRVDPAPDSRRDKIVSVTEKGQSLRSFAAGQIRKIELDCQERIGSDGLENLRRLLLSLLARP